MPAFGKRRALIAAAYVCIAVASGCAPSTPTTSSPIPESLPPAPAEPTLPPTPATVETTPEPPVGATAPAPSPPSGPTSSAPPATGPEPSPGEIILEPAGPFVEGDWVRLVTSAEDNVDLWNAHPLFCARLAGAEEYCTVATDAPVADNRRGLPDGRWIEIPVPRWHFGPTGLVDCASADVSCRFRFRLWPDGSPSSPELIYEGESTAPANVATIVPGTEPGQFVLDVQLVDDDPLEVLGEESIAWIAATVGGEGAFDPSRLRFEWDVRTICAFGDGGPPIGSGPLREAPHWWGLNTTRGTEPHLATNCDWTSGTAIEPDLIDLANVDIGVPIDLEIRRALYGYGGWVDCAEAPCFVQVILRWLHPMRGGGMVGSDHVVARVLIDPPPDWPDPLLPTIRILEPAPYAPGQQVTVEARNIWSDNSTGIAFCQGTNPCLYKAINPVEDAVTQVLWTLPTSGCEANSCYFAIDSASEGLPPPAIVVVTTTE